eukprot:COSAG06_NODE_1756_length_8453_cov_2.365159_7_plen_49_part_00
MAAPSDELYSREDVRSSSLARAAALARGAWPGETVAASRSKVRDGSKE